MARDLVVRALNRRATSGIATIGPLSIRCSLGRTGMSYRKRESDGATPVGRWPVLDVLYRPDRRHGLYGTYARGMRRLRPCDGWCDAAGDRNYNRPVRHPYPASAETLWRDDHAGAQGEHHPRIGKLAQVGQTVMSGVPDPAVARSTGSRFPSKTGTQVRPEEPAVSH